MTNTWLLLRQIGEAIRAGRLDDAHRLLAAAAARGHRKVWDLERQLLRAYVDRGEQRLRFDDAAGAWTHLMRAEAIDAADAAAAGLRTTLSRLGMAEVRALLEAGQPDRAAEAVARLRDRGVRLPELQPLDDAARSWMLAADLADRGEFALARQCLDRARAMLPEVSHGGPDRFGGDLDCRREAFQAALPKIDEAIAAKQWREAVQLADAALAAAPQYAEARRLRQRAWQALEPETADHVPSEAAAPEAEELNAPSLPAGPMKRFLLWVDGVGGYLVCLGNRVTFGQAASDAPVDVPLFADVSRLHGHITRDTEGYVFESSRGAQVNGRPAARATLSAGDRITLGPSCQLVFQQPVPVSVTARLDLVSGHRMPLAVDGVLLMADSLVLGPGPKAHVVIDELEKPVVIYKQKDGLGVRHAGEFRIDGRPCKDRAMLPTQGGVTGPAFAFAVEPVGRVLGR